MKKLLATAVTAAVLASGGVAVAGATGDSGSSAPATATSTDQAAHPRAHRRLQVAKLALSTSAKTIGISAKDLVTQLRDGKTVAEVAQAHDVDPQTVEDAITKAIDDRIDQAVAAGKLEEPRAATLKDKVAERVQKFVEDTPPRAGHHGERRILQPVKVAAQAIGIQPKDLVAAVRDGQTVAQVAQAHDVDPQTVIDALVKAGETRLEKLATRFVNETPHHK